MKSNNDIELQYSGTHIRIGKSKTNGHIYFQPIQNASFSNLWMRFEREYYKDYKYFLRDFDMYEMLNNNSVEEITCPNLSYYTFLDKETLEYYIETYKPVSVFINGDCVLDDSSDVSYTITQYCSDMEDMKKNNYYPFINEIKINVVDNHHYTLSFKVCIKHKEEH